MTIAGKSCSSISPPQMRKESWPRKLLLSLATPMAAAAFSVVIINKNKKSIPVNLVFMAVNPFSFG